MVAFDPRFSRPITDWNRTIHNALTPDQMVDTIAPARDVTNDASTTSEQVGAGLMKKKKIILTPRRGYDFSDVEQLGSGPINWAINHLPFEIHLYDKERKLRYNFCGPGTKLEERLKRGDVGINKLDEKGCKPHDIFYSKHKDSESRREADARLAQIAQEVANDPDASKDERAKANLVAAAMHGMTWIGAGQYGGGKVNKKHFKQTFLSQPIQIGGAPGEAASSSTTSTIGAIINAISSLYDYIKRRKGEIKADKDKKKAEEDAQKVIAPPSATQYTPSKW